jgi:hypothetical protein
MHGPMNVKIVIPISILNFVNKNKMVAEMGKIVQVRSLEKHMQLLR